MSVAAHQIVGRLVTEADVIPTITSLVRDDWRFLEECALDAAELEQWRLASALRRCAQMTGQWLGTNPELLSDELFSYVSLTERIRSGGGEQQTLGARGAKLSDTVEPQ